jgi:hypothetical protein
MDSKGGMRADFALQSHCALGQRNQAECWNGRVS